MQGGAEVCVCVCVCVRARHCCIVVQAQVYVKDSAQVYLVCLFAVSYVCVSSLIMQIGIGTRGLMCV